MLLKISDFVFNVLLILSVIDDLGWLVISVDLRFGWRNLTDFGSVSLSTSMTKRGRPFKTQTTQTTGDKSFAFFLNLFKSDTVGSARVLHYLVVSCSLLHSLLYIMSLFQSETFGFQWNCAFFVFLFTLLYNDF